jgi:hypothetical protein
MAIVTYAVVTSTLFLDAHTLQRNPSQSDDIPYTLPPLRGPKSLSAVTSSSVELVGAGTSLSIAKTRTVDAST